MHLTVCINFRASLVALCLITFRTPLYTANQKAQPQLLASWLSDFLLEALQLLFYTSAFVQILVILFE